MKIKSVVFVCTGNTCRSPMAEALLKKFLAEKNFDVNVFSRGLSVFESSPASINSIEAIKKYGVDLTEHTSKLLLKSEIWSVDLILTMSNSHKNIITSMFPQFSDKVFTVYEFAFNKKIDISDPFGGNLKVYEACLDEIYKCVENIVVQNKLCL